MLKRITFERAWINEVIDCVQTIYKKKKDEIMLTRLTRYSNFNFLLSVPIHCKPDK